MLTRWVALLMRFLYSRDGLVCSWGFSIHMMSCFSHMVGFSARGMGCFTHGMSFLMHPLVWIIQCRNYTLRLLSLKFVDVRGYKS